MAIGRARLGALIGLGAVGTVLAIGLANCAEPTQLEIDVRTDACGVLKNAGISVSTPDRIDTTKLANFTPERPDNAGCEASPRDRVGTLIIYPSGAKDAEVGIRVVGGISRTAEECDRSGNYAGCIVARRVERFVEGSSKRVIVILSRACEGKDCGLGKECSPSGTCVVNLPDGGTEDGGVLDAATLPEGSIDAPSDAAADVVVDAGFDACSGCTGAGTTCSAGKCTIDCAAAGAGACSQKAVCAPGLDCNIKCVGQNACTDVSCAAGANSCFFDCDTNGNPACSNITCRAPSCFVECNNGGKCAGTMTLGGTDAGLACLGNSACDAVTNVSCDASTCNLACSGSCPQTKTCVPSATTTCAGANW